jgi:hypothetical protein
MGDGALIVFPQREGEEKSRFKGFSMGTIDLVGNTISNEKQIRV